MALQVECRTDEGGEVPVRFGHGGASQEVAEVVDRWLGEDHRYYRVRTEDGGLFILRYDQRDDSWQISLFEGDSPSARRPDGQG